MTITVHHGDSRDVLDTMAEDSVDSCVCDPPYALQSIVARFGGEDAAPPAGGVYARAVAGFMGETWDTGEVAFDPEFWRKVWRVLKPGAWVFAFGGSRTYGRLQVALEDAGFEVRDSVLDIIASDSAALAFMASLDEEQLRALAKVAEESQPGGLFAWLYGTGFPKNTDWAAVPGSKKHGGRQVRPEFVGTPFEDGWGDALKPAFEPVVVARKPFKGPIHANVLKHGVGGLNIGDNRIGAETITTAAKGKGSSFTSVGAGQGFEGCEESTHVGRWPANVVTDGSPEVADAFPETSSGVLAPHHKGAGQSKLGTFDIRDRSGEAHSTFGDSGSAMRFFFTAKADAEDRLGIPHPTVKPTGLMRHFVSLATPPGGVVLDPFAGSGTTGIAAMGLGLDAILIEREAKYVEGIRRKIAWATGEGRLTALEQARDFDPLVAAGGDTPLFGGGV